MNLSPRVAGAMVMKKQPTRDLMRLLHGELPSEKKTELLARLSEDPILAGEYESLRQVWSGLELPPPEPPPARIVDWVMNRIRRRQAVRGDIASLRWSHAPVGVRAASACALGLGVVLGILAGIGGRAPSADEYLAPEPTLAEAYWLTFEMPVDEDTLPEKEVL